MVNTKYIPYVYKIFSSTIITIPQVLSDKLTNAANTYYRFDLQKEDFFGYIFRFSGKEIRYRYKNKYDLWRVLEPVLKTDNHRRGKGADDRKKFVSTLFATINNKITRLPDFEDSITPEQAYVKLFSTNPSAEPTTIPQYDTSDSWKIICNSEQLLLWYFFNLDPSVDNNYSEIKEHADIWHISCSYSRNINQLKQKVYKELRTITAKAEEHPLYLHLFEKPLKNRHEICELLRLSYQYQGEQLMIKPPVGVLIDWIYFILKEQICPFHSFSVDDFIIFTGILAELASNNPSKNVEDSDFQKAKVKAISFGLQSEYIDSIILYLFDIINNSQRDSSAQWLIHQHGQIRFKIRPFRLTFFALYAALSSNRRKGDNQAKYIIDLFESEYPKSEIPEENVDVNQIKNKYDSYIFFSAAVLLALDTGIQEEVLFKLCNTALNFKVDNRGHQIGAINTLSYFLCERPSLPSSLRNKIFYSVYQQTLYPLQINEFQYILRASQYFKTTIIDSLSKACNITEKTTVAPFNKLLPTTKNQPHFLFLMGFLLDESTNQQNKEHDGTMKSVVDQYFFTACEFERETWYYQRRVPPEIVANRIIEAERIFQDVDGNHDFTIKVSYAVNLLAYALTNSAMEENTPFLLKNDGSPNEQLHKKLLGIILKSDYYLRKYNSLYHQYIEQNKSRGPNSIIDEIKPEGRMFLPCGALRFVCAYAKSPNLQDYLGSEMQCYYEYWLMNESPRNKVLMARLLSYAPLPQIKNVIFTEVTKIKNEITDRSFLQYDRVDCELIKQSENENDLLNALKVLKK